MRVDYHKEFFDRTYTTREAYARVWRYARKYKFRIFVGIVCGMLTAGTLLPLFQAVQPALEKVSENERVAALKAEFAESAVAEGRDSTDDGRTVAASATGAGVGKSPSSSLERELARKSKLPGWYPKAEKLARKCGIELQDASGAMGGALLLIAVVVIPLVAALRLLFIFLNQYCLAWAATRVVMDLRIDLFRQIQRQSMQFHGRIDVGQLMSRASNDPIIVQNIIQHMLAELARAPFEILAAVAFIIYFAWENHMFATLGVIAIGLPAFMVPVIGIGKRIRHWSRKTLEKNSVVGSNIHELLTCVRVVKAYGTEEQENLRYERTNRGLLGTTMRAVRCGLIVGPTIETVGILLI